MLLIQEDQLKPVVCFPNCMLMQNKETQQILKKYRNMKEDNVPDKNTRLFLPTWYIWRSPYLLSCSVPTLMDPISHVTVALHLELGQNKFNDLH